MNYLLLVLKFLPAVIEAVAAIQRVMGEASGEAKKAMVVESVKNVAGHVLTPDDTRILSDTIDSVVTVANRFGVLGKAGPSPAKPAK